MVFYLFQWKCMLWFFTEPIMGKKITDSWPSQSEFRSDLIKFRFQGTNPAPRVKELIFQCLRTLRPVPRVEDLVQCLRTLPIPVPRVKELIFQCLRTLRPVPRVEDLVQCLRTLPTPVPRVKELIFQCLRTLRPVPRVESCYVPAVGHYSVWGHC